MMEELHLTLPLPARGVSPNARRGESRAAAVAKARMVRAHRVLAKLRTREAMTAAGLRAPLPARGYRLEFFWKTAAYRDDDNADASCKAYRDGIADALEINDRALCKTALSKHATDRENPRLEVRISLGKDGGLQMSPEHTNLIERWAQTAIRVQDTFGKIENALMASPENEIRTAIWDMFGEYTRTLAAQLSDDAEDARGWLEWFAGECDFGRKPREIAFANGEKLLVVGAADLLAAIRTDDHGNRV